MVRSPSHGSAKQELTERIVRVYPTLSPKKRRVADFILRDYKKLFLMTARDLSRECQVSEPTVMRFTVDLGFSGYTEFERFIKGLLHMELTSVERLTRTGGQTNGDSVLHRHSRNAMVNLENMMNSGLHRDLEQMAKIIHRAPEVVVAGYKASAVLAQYLGYLLKKIRGGVRIQTTPDSDLMDHIALTGRELVLFAIAFPRYPRSMVELIDYAKKFKVKVIGLSDTLTSPIVIRSDKYAVIDLEGISFVDPFGHIVTFLGALIHRVAFMEEGETVKRLTRLERGVKERGEFYTEEDGGCTSESILNLFAESDGAGRD